MRRTAASSRAWMSQGACRDANPDLFFPVAAKGATLRDIARAKTVCRRCAVRLACLAYAVENGQEGIWGGTTNDERRAMQVRPSPGAAIPIRGGGGVAGAPALD
ncbi:MAG: WhiB family transcriptional regulator [Streptosporangiaceae bacterium]